MRERKQGGRGNVTSERASVFVALHLHFTGETRCTKSCISDGSGCLLFVQLGERVVLALHRENRSSSEALFHVFVCLFGRCFLLSWRGGSKRHEMMGGEARPKRFQLVIDEHPPWFTNDGF